MKIQIDVQIFRWLQTSNILKEGTRINETKVQLSEQATLKFYDGISIALILRKIPLVENNQQMIEKLNALKENSTPAIRLYNWNILSEVLKRLGYSLQYGEKSKILNFQVQPLKKVLDYLYRKKEQSEIQNQNPQPLELKINSVLKKQLNQAQNILQFFVISISKHFKLSPQHTLNLFLDNNKYLAHLLVKGVKGSFEPIFALFDDIEENIKYIVVNLFCVDERQSLKFFLNALKPALISKEVLICEKTIQIFQQMLTTYDNNAMSINLIYEWVKSEGINTIFFAMKRHLHLFEELFAFVYTILDEELFKYIQPIQKSPLWDNDQQKLEFFQNLLMGLKLEIIKIFVQSRTFSSWLKIFIKLMKRTIKKNEIHSLMNIMEWLWMNLQKQFEENQMGLPNAFLSFLNTTSSHESEIIYVQSVRIMFSLMEELGNRKNSYAPLFYRILINSFSSIVERKRIQFMALNFKESFEKIKNLPGGPLISPLIRSLQEKVTLNCLQLCVSLLRQNRLGEEQLVNIIDMFTRIVFSDPYNGSIALDSIFQNLQVMNQQMVEQFLDTNSTHCLAHFFSYSKSINRKFSELKSDYQRYAREESMKKGGNIFCSEMQKHILLGNLVKFMEKCIETSVQLKQNFEPLLFHTYLRINKELLKQEQAELLIPLMKYYYPAEDQLQIRIAQFQEQINPPNLKSEESVQNLLKNKSKISQSAQLSNSSKISKPLDFSIFKPSPYAIKDLEKVKEKLSFVRAEQMKKQREKDLFQSKKEMFRSMINEKRLIEFGVKNKANLQYKCIYEWNTAKEDKVSGVLNIKLLNLANQEENAFAEDVNAILKKYRKLFRSLFMRFSSSASEEKINIAEIWKMLRQNDAIFIKKQESQVIVRLINQNMNRKNDLLNLTYLGFQEYLLQFCYFGYEKIGCGHLTPGQKLMKFIKQLKKSAQEKGSNTEIFENPEQVYVQESDVIKEFNRRLQENPDYILPEGYKKVYLTELKYNYEVSTEHTKPISSSFLTVLQVLDEIFSEQEPLGFHIIEPSTYKEEKIIAKPALFQSLNEKMKEYKSGYLLPKRSQKKEQEKFKKVIGFKREYHPLVNFSIGIKLGLAGVSMKNRFIADEVAYWMDDMLDSIEQESLKVGNKGKKKVDNEALKRKRAYLHKSLQEQKQQEKKWKMRAESIKVQAQANRQKKQEEEKNKRKLRREEKQAQREKKIVVMKRKLQKFETVKKKLEEKRNVEEMAKKSELEKKKKEKQDYKKGVQQYFKKKKQEIEEKNVNFKKLREEEKEKEKEASEKRLQVAKKLFHSILKQEEGVIDQIEQTKKGFEELYYSEQIQNTFKMWENPLRYLFDLLRKYEKSKISATNEDQISLSTLHFFAIKFKIVPFMIQKNTLAKIYKTILKNNAFATGINFEQFEEALFRITVKSKELLNGIIQKRGEKKKQLEQFLVKKSSTGNHHEIDEEIAHQSPSKIEKTPKVSSITDDYLYNVEGVTSETVKELLKFLNLPNDRLGVEERFKEVIESKGTKPTSILIKELRNSLIDK